MRDKKSERMVEREGKREPAATIPCKKNRVKEKQIQWESLGPQKCMIWRSTINGERIKHQWGITQSVHQMWSYFFIVFNAKSAIVSSVTSMTLCVTWHQLDIRIHVQKKTFDYLSVIHVHTEHSKSCAAAQ